MDDDAAGDLISANDHIVERDAAASHANGAFSVVLGVEREVLKLQVDGIREDEEALAIGSH